MDRADRDALRRRLAEERERLTELMRQQRESSEPVQLDQTRFGRLSRMDALRAQALSQAGLARSAQRLRRIDATLARIDGEEFGECPACGAPIALPRLMADPTASLCIACAEAGDA